MWLLQGKEIQLPDDGLRTKTCWSSFSVLVCKFYISILVGTTIEWLDNMHGVTMKIVLIALMGASHGICLPHCWCMATGGALILVT